MNESTARSVSRDCSIELCALLCTVHHTTTFLLPYRMSSHISEGHREEALSSESSLSRIQASKQQLINETEKARPSVHHFVGQNLSMEDSLKNSTVGLVKFEDFQLKRKELEEAKARESARTDELK
jgi:protein FAM50